MRVNQESRRLTRVHDDGGLMWSKRVDDKLRVGEVVVKGSKLFSTRGKYANARVHLSQHHAHVFPGSFRTHCRPNRIPTLPPGPLPPLPSPPPPSLPPSPILRRFTSKLAWSPGLIDRQVMGQFNLISKINNHSRLSRLLNLFRNSRFSKVAPLVGNTAHCP